MTHYLSRCFLVACITPFMIATDKPPLKPIDPLSIGLLPKYALIGDTVEVPICSPAITGAPQRVYRIVIHRPSFGSGDRIVRRMLKEETTLSAEMGPLQDQPILQVSDNIRTRYDIDDTAASPPKLTAGQYFTVKIVIGPTLRFIDMPYTIRVPKDNKAICDLERIDQYSDTDPRKKWYFVKFKIVYTEPGSTISNYNIGVVLPDDDLNFNTPIIIDPKVKNDG